MSDRLLTPLAAVLISSALVVLWPRGAAADGQPDPSGGGSNNAGVQGLTSGATTNGSDVTVNAGLTQGTGGGSGAPATTVTTSSGSQCTSQAVDPVTAASLINHNPDASATMTGDPGSGTWYLITCPGTTPSLLFVGGSGGGQPARPPLAQPGALAQQALATMHLPGPSVQMSPPSNAELVNFQDWLAIDRSIWHPISATATAGPVSATATATPDRVVYDMGNGAQVVCTGPGTPYNPNVPPDRQSTNCSYTYPNSSAGQPNHQFTSSATVYWSVTWTAVGAPGGGNLGEIPGDTTSVQVEVDEVQAVNEQAR